MTVSEAEVKRKLEAVPNAYREFVVGILVDVRDYGIGDEVASFIDENPNLSSGHVIKYVDDLLGFTEPLKIVKEE